MSFKLYQQICENTFIQAVLLTNIKNVAVFKLYESFYDYVRKTDEIKPQHVKTNKMTCAPSKDSDQPGHLPSLIRVFTMHLMGS